MNRILSILGFMAGWEEGGGRRESRGMIFRGLSAKYPSRGEEKVEKALTLAIIPSPRPQSKIPPIRQWHTSESTRRESNPPESARIFSNLLESSRTSAKRGRFKRLQHSGWIFLSLFLAFINIFLSFSFIFFHFLSFSLHFLWVFFFFLSFFTARENAPIKIIQPKTRTNFPTRNKTIK